MTLSGPISFLLSHHSPSSGHSKMTGPLFSMARRLSASDAAHLWQRNTCQTPSISRNVLAALRCSNFPQVGQCVYTFVRLYNVSSLGAYSFFSSQYRSTSGHAFAILLSFWRRKSSCFFRAHSTQEVTRYVPSLSCVSASQMATYRSLPQSGQRMYSFFPDDMV